MTDSIASHAAATDKLVPFQRIFLTGGSGYVGRNLIRHFVARGVAVIALVRSDVSADIVRALGAVPLRGDLFDAALAAGMTGCNALIHAAADTDHGPATERQRRINEDGTRAVLDAARAAGIAKVIHLSTESVLATGQPLVNVDETMPLPAKPAGGYSRTKAAAERIALVAHGPDFSVVVLRPRFVWGRDDTTALPTLLEAVRSGKFAWISGGTYLTSTTHVANLCHAVELALSQGHGGQVYFISDGDPVPFRTFVSALIETQGLAVPDKIVPRLVVRAVAAIGDVVAKISGGRIVPPLTLQAYATSAVEVSFDIGRARCDLGYAPVISREEGLTELRSVQH
ncbi:Nucleoside-diphosphate-sugar epimerase [Phyllobacterium sp. CL33Tsu]|uniref:NAD-dependent epimerase/dehydratase family protein n=1 Tax=Phyllobacterium sp. CL33Tsu TaxID=1798191 RepID=UPI0008EB6672|nr:NAD-dependent epimerase/dehydratase family protein [Phyllobacterium sp. CL33Tsu]SFJ03180.1 Nucleoside-diphosphate-sugar epimerase [Phyllobacterium sp. CL33Tsu]